MPLSDFVYSAAEERLFTVMGYNDVMGRISPVNLYKIAVVDAFLNHRRGPEIEALRRGLNALVNHGDIHRMTPAFDELVMF